MLRKRRNPAPIEWGVVCAAKRETQAANQSVENPIEIDNLLLSIVGRGEGRIGWQVAFEILQPRLDGLHHTENSFSGIDKFR